MVNTMKTFIALVVIYGAVHWAVHNPKSASKIVDNVDSAFIWTKEIFTDNFLDSNS